MPEFRSEFATAGTDLNPGIQLVATDLKGSLQDIQNRTLHNPFLFRYQLLPTTRAFLLSLHIQFACYRCFSLIPENRPPTICCVVGSHSNKVFINTSWPNLVHHPVNDEMDSFWENTQKLLMAKNHSRNNSINMLQHQPECVQAMANSHARSRSNTMTSSMRSRTNTMTSSMSFYDTLTPESSVGDISQPASREEGFPLSPERKESTTKTLLSKGSRMLRRPGNKFNVLSSTHSDVHGMEKSHWDNPSSDLLTKHHKRKPSAADLKSND